MIRVSNSLTGQLPTITETSKILEQLTGNKKGVIRGRASFFLPALNPIWMDQKRMLLPHGVHLKNETFYALIILVMVGQKVILLTARSRFGGKMYSLLFRNLPTAHRLSLAPVLGVGCPSWQLAKNHSISPRLFLSRRL